MVTINYSDRSNFFFVSFCLLRDHWGAFFSQKLQSLVFEYGLPPGSGEKILKNLL